MRNKLVIGMVSGFLLLSFAGTQAQPQKEAVINLPEGLRHVPADGMGFIYVRTGKFLESKMGQSLRQELLRDEETKGIVKKAESQLGMSMKDLESVTLVFLEPVLEGPRGFRPNE